MMEKKVISQGIEAPIRAWCKKVGWDFDDRFEVYRTDSVVSLRDKPLDNLTEEQVTIDRMYWKTANG